MRWLWFAKIRSTRDPWRSRWWARATRSERRPSVNPRPLRLPPECPFSREIQGRDGSRTDVVVRGDRYAKGGHGHRMQVRTALAELTQPYRSTNRCLQSQPTSQSRCRKDRRCLSAPNVFPPRVLFAPGGELRLRPVGGPSRTRTNSMVEPGCPAHFARVGTGHGTLPPAAALAGC
jgi:hypothetical protein